MILTEYSERNIELATEEHFALLRACGRILGAEMKVILESRAWREYLRLAVEKEAVSTPR